MLASYKPLSLNNYYFLNQRALRFHSTASDNFFLMGHFNISPDEPI